MKINLLGVCFYIYYYENSEVDDNEKSEKKEKEKKKKNKDKSNNKKEKINNEPAPSPKEVFGVKDDKEAEKSLKEIIDKIDKDGNGEISIQEYSDMMKNIII